MTTKRSMRNKYNSMSSFLLGSLFFTILIFKMGIEFCVSFILRSIGKPDLLYNFREADVSAFDIFDNKGTAFRAIELGDIPKRKNEIIAFEIPNIIFDKAEVLLDIQLNSQVFDLPFDVELELSNNTKISKEYIYLFNESFENTSYEKYNSLPLWCQVPDDRIITLQLTEILSDTDIEMNAKLVIVNVR